ncbi:hypothetical protein SAMD00019534_010750 [Acytostelium subglobosum LB1]|uniref:hypothetical protein n=1 Tax=Acytostelium subglobosum LB1 TaxID=1410327 RepID=UPI000645115D|nr:hypothetical protein SAMD00019534_010750 [Acytostelium subglobosum LB1]GAM17900.1 hypothetical protein SAMD00019534_010750 [Acytostelium subglobosum LB1]|eukprot:XP_012758496.1 hypothetical protein SAMD00019534_010750 [Acytostelium subglobosum LB1]
MSNNIAVRIRSKAGVENIRSLDSATTTIATFQSLIQEKTGIEVARQKILCGYPPAALDVTDKEQTIAKYITNGDTITVEEIAVAGGESSVPASATTATTKPATSSSSSNTSGPEGTIVRRLTENDNSCLFSAVAYVLEHKNRAKASHLRSIIVNVVKQDPFTYNEGFLGMDNSSYCAWITNPKHWGGAIELSILSQHYKVEIGAFDISTKILYRYGEDCNYKERVYVVYDGIHYDALALSPVKIHPSPEEYDITIFSSNDATTLKKATSFIEKENKEGKFTDTNKFQLICLDCNKVLVGEKEASMHAMETKHSKFTELKQRV